MAKSTGALGPKQRQNYHEQFAEAPPELNVLSDLALHDTDAHNEQFGLQEKIGPIYDILRHPKTRTPMAIAIYGDWGSGKTSAMRWLQSLLNHWNDHPPKGKKKEPHIRVKSVWFDPWKYDKKEDVWRGLLAEVIIKSINVEDATLGELKKAVVDFGGFLGRSFVHAVAGLKLKATIPGTGTGAELSLTGLKDILDEYRQTAHPEKALLNEFESTLKNWINTTLGPDERMVIFIDDLDRCMPEIALQVLEALKLYLSTDKLIFVVGVDRKVIEELVVGYYKKLELDPEKSIKYLAKMFQVEVELSPSEQQIEQFFGRQLKEISYWTMMSKEAQGIFERLILEMADRNPREVKRLLNSALMVGVGGLIASRSNPGTKLDDDARGIKVTQGLQEYFLKKILREKYRFATIFDQRIGQNFFREWSKILQNHPKAKNTINIPSQWIEDIKSAEKTDQMMDQLGNVIMDIESYIQNEIDEFYRDLVGSIFFKQSHPELFTKLLREEQVGELMRIPFPTPSEEEEAKEVTQRAPSRSEQTEIIREAIARSLDKDPDSIDPEDFDKVESLDLRDLGLTSIDDLSNLKNLKTLRLDSTAVTDLTPLAALTGLLTIGLTNTAVTDLTPLAALTGLQTLRLTNTAVTDLTPLAALTGLQILRLDSTTVTDLTPLAALTGLQILWLNDTAVTDLSTLAALTGLHTLWLDNTAVTDLTPLAALNGLQALWLENSAVTDLTPLAALNGLQRLGLNDTAVTEEQIKQFKETHPDCTVFG